MLKALDPRPGELVLDIGCGTGYYVGGIAKAGATAVGIDLAPNYVRQASEYVTRNTNASAPHHVAAAEAKHLPFGNATFDKVLMTEVLEHLIDYPRSLEEISRILKPSGRAVITTPSKYSPLNLAYHWKAHRRKYAFHEHIVELTPGKFEQEMHQYFHGVRLSFANFLVPYPVDMVAERVVSPTAARGLAWAEQVCQRLPILRRAGWTMIAIGRKPQR